MSTKGTTIKPRRIRIFDPIFKQEVVVFVNMEWAQFLAWEKRMKVTNTSEPEADPNKVAFTTHLSAKGEPNIYVIWLPDFDWYIADQGTLVHELIHVTTRIWEANNIAFSPETQEFFAHTVGILYEMVAKVLLPKKTPKKGR